MMMIWTSIYVGRNVGPLFKVGGFMRKVSLWIFEAQLHSSEKQPRLPCTVERGEFLSPDSEHAYNINHLTR